jgi:hypothetical protein
VRAAQEFDATPTGIASEYVEKPQLQVQRIGEGWNVPLERIGDPLRRATIKADVEQTSQRLAQAGDPIPGSCELYELPSATLVIALPARLRAGQPAIVTCLLWDHDSSRAALRLTVQQAHQPLQLDRPARQERGCLQLRFRLTVDQQGPVVLEVVLRRGDELLRSATLPLMAGAGEQP